MTTEEKAKKIQILKKEIDQVNLKRAKLSLQLDNLNLRLERLEGIIPKDPKVPSPEEKEKQSQADKESLARALEERLINSDFSETDSKRVSRMVLKE